VQGDLRGNFYFRQFFTQYFSFVYTIIEIGKQCYAKISLLVLGAIEPKQFAVLCWGKNYPPPPYCVGLMGPTPPHRWQGDKIYCGRDYDTSIPMHTLQAWGKILSDKCWKKLSSTFSKMDPVCPYRSDPDPIQTRPDPQHWSHPSTEKLTPGVWNTRGQSYNWLKTDHVLLGWL
jgi:hypothetical protein